MKTMNDEELKGGFIDMTDFLVDSHPGNGWEEIIEGVYVEKIVMLLRGR